MDKYQTTIKLSINEYQIVVHKYVLEKLPFFDDFVKSSNEEINIKYDGDIDSNIIEYLFKSLYGIPNTDITFLEQFKLFKLADFLCIDLPKKLECSGTKKSMLEYVLDKNDLDILLKFKRYYNIDFSLHNFDCIDENWDLIMKIKDNFDLCEINCFFGLGKYKIIVDVLKNKMVNFTSYNELYILLANIKKMIQSDSLEEDQKELLKYILFEYKKPGYWFSDHGISFYNLQKQYTEKFENKS